MGIVYTEEKPITASTIKKDRREYNFTSGFTVLRGEQCDWVSNILSQDSILYKSFDTKGLSLMVHILIDWGV